MKDLIDRQAAMDALNGIINRFEQILRDIRESKVDDSVCGMCEYDGAFVGQSGDWCNECPGFEKDDCFKLSDECRKRWLESVKLPTAQPDIDVKFLIRTINAGIVATNTKDVYSCGMRNGMRWCRSLLEDEPPKQVSGMTECAVIVIVWITVMTIVLIMK